MQALSPSHYARLEWLVGIYRQHYLAHFKQSARYNPRLGMDALCFRAFGTDELLGVWITPLSLSLACVSIEAKPTSNVAEDGAIRIIRLPSGDYRFVAERLTPSETLWRCELLDDLADLEGADEAARLAQQVIERVMTADGEAR